MTIELDRDTREAMIASIRRYFAETLDEEIGELKAGLLLDFCLVEICPTAYNRAIRDAQAYFLGKVEDLEGSCFEPELGYWKNRR